MALCNSCFTVSFKCHLSSSGFGGHRVGPSPLLSHSDLTVAVLSWDPAAPSLHHPPTNHAAPSFLSQGVLWPTKTLLLAPVQVGRKGGKLSQDLGKQEQSRKQLAKRHWRSLRQIDKQTDGGNEELRGQGTQGNVDLTEWEEEVELKLINIFQGGSSLFLTRWSTQSKTKILT